ncbi:hypothetical protein K3495_g8552 [Podosphaera aphanis]|nr:hypothetical protein K3495_g8552 [Podosphaera aphanis]
MACPLWSEGRTDIWRKAKNGSFEATLSSPEDIGRITQWILDQGWIEQFRLAGEVEAQIKQREESQKKGKIKVNNWRDGYHTGFNSVNALPEGCLGNSEIKLKKKPGRKEGFSPKGFPSCTFKVDSYLRGPL